MQPATAEQPAVAWGALASLRTHWIEYACEASELALFMISASVFGVLLEHPSSTVHQAIDSGFVRRALMGVAMGTTALSIVKSPLGQRSGAHFNPAITLSYYLLGKVRGWDALFYVVAQFAGAVAGVAFAAAFIGPPLAHAAVRYVVTVPGMAGSLPAFTAEITISALLMLAILTVSNSSDWHRFTPYFAAALVATFITFEAPLSGMSMNPARTTGSASIAGIWTSLWVYFTAPPLGMFIAARVYTLIAGHGHVFCAKLHHNNRHRCIFRCNYADLQAVRSLRAGSIY
jgi:aquaporin Z